MIQTGREKFEQRFTTQIILSVCQKKIWAALCHSNCSKYWGAENLGSDSPVRTANLGMEMTREHMEF
jgi:hypothetical protein